MNWQIINCTWTQYMNKIRNCIINSHFLFYIFLFLKSIFAQFCKTKILHQHKFSFLLKIFCIKQLDQVLYDKWNKTRKKLSFLESSSKQHNNIHCHDIQIFYEYIINISPSPTQCWRACTRIETCHKNFVNDQFKYTRIL